MVTSWSKPFVGDCTIYWTSVGPNHGQNEGHMTLTGWLRRGWRKAEDLSPADRERGRAELARMMAEVGLDPPPPRG